VDKNCFCSRQKIGPYLQEMYNIRQSTSFIINKKICFLKSYERKFSIMFDNKTRNIVWPTRQVYRIMDFQTAKDINLNKSFINKIRGERIAVIWVLDVSD